MNSYTWTLVLGFCIRLGFIIYGEWHDSNFQVPFTDVDYKVFVDAARYVSEGESPYKRDTYRYPPILAWLLVPSVVFPIWGKILFSIFDILTGIIIKKLVKEQGLSDYASLKCAQLWLFNPLTIIISTRGNSDSIISLAVLLSVYYLLKCKPALAGLFLALSIHIRLYPIIFSLPMYLSLKSEGNSSKLFDKVRILGKKLIPDKNQFFLAGSCICFLFIFTGFSFYLYGMEFLQESILYHLSRKDTRHNFSVYFYLLYLQPEQPSLVMFLPQLILLLALAVTYGHKATVLFCVFAQTYVVVAFNPVQTSQYFIWYLSLLIPNLPRFELTKMETAKLVSFWLLSQLAWLLPAYLLEFRGRNTFLNIWLQGIGFFCANVGIIVKLIKRYKTLPDVEKVKVS